MECGCKLSIFEVDPTTQEYFRSVNRKSMYEIHAGSKASYKDEYDIDIGKIVPEVAEPGNVDKVKEVGEVEGTPIRSEEHTSELQSRGHLVCRLLLEKKKIREL